ncbi:hypothetical protein NA78x_001776 [Anatilimnocola sp. NA78]|uniref:hypothetical protein n=1 Tax=Anatilimnocola sp. NA78 TaxID=3415683 RepID=UPI003CE519CC
MSVPPCPMCGHSRNATAQRGDRSSYFFCSVHGLYDDKPDEGGDYADHRPDIRIEREERRRENQSRNRFNRR